MQAETPQEWHECMYEVMERFDVEARDDWRPIIQDDQSRILLGLWLKWKTPTKPHVMMTPEFVAMPTFLWQTVPPDDVIWSIADVIGKLRGDGDESLTPVNEGYTLTALGLLTEEHHRVENRDSTTLYLTDRLGNFYTRRFMGAAKPEVTHGFIPAGDDAQQKAAEHPDFTNNHGALSTLLNACLAPPEACRQTFGDNVFRQLKDLILTGNLAALMMDPAHPMHPSRAN